MQKITIVFVTAFMLILISCETKTDNATLLNTKKTKLEDLKKQQVKLGEEIVKLENEITLLDTSATKQENAKLVSITSIEPHQFNHFINLQGKIEAVNIMYVTPRAQGGQVKELLVKQGDFVKKGTLLLKLDDAIVKKQLDQLQTQLSFAKDLYQRQQNLWKENIGTEVQLLQAKNSVDNIEKQINTVKEQLSFSNVYAPIDGVLETVDIRVGETFIGVLGQSPQISIVNTSNLKLTAQVPENYLEKVKVGTRTKITFPDINKTIEASINVVGKIIDPLSRSFYIEAKLPADKDLKPNQVAEVKILDYSVANAITVPINTIQTDEKGKFVIVALEQNGKIIAHKTTVSIGELYGDKIEINSGLKPGDKLITDGFQNLYEGQLITTDQK